jgi:hypothetical protein
MKLHLNRALYRDAIRFTSQQMNLQPEFVEKDYWVTYVLHTIFAHEVGAHTVFKGGTALSKCYELIERFSEDIDLVVLRRTTDSNNMLTHKIRTISEVVGAVLPEVEMTGITQKKGMNRKTAHAYSKTFSGNYNQVRDVIVLEATWLGSHEPYSTKKVVSYVGHMMLSNDQVDLATEYQLLPFDLLVLEPTRTICEKIMSLIRFSYGENPIDDLKKKIRHTYDLHQLLKQDALLKFFQTTAFDEMLIKVAHDDVASFKNNNQWLVHHPKEALIFKNLESVWAELKSTYTGDFKNLVYGALPNEKNILETLKMIQERLEAISWAISIE